MKGVKISKAEKKPRPLTDGYVRQTLRKKGIDKEYITPKLIELQRIKLELDRTLREFIKVVKVVKGRSCQG